MAWHDDPGKFEDAHYAATNREPPPGWERQRVGTLHIERYVRPVEALRTTSSRDLGLRPPEPRLFDVRY